MVVELIESKAVAKSCHSSCVALELMLFSIHLLFVLLFLYSLCLSFVVLIAFVVMLVLLLSVIHPCALDSLGCMTFWGQASFWFFSKKGKLPQFLELHPSPDSDCMY